MAALSRSALLTLAAIATGLALSAEPSFAIQPTQCYPSSLFQGAPREVNSEAECRKTCAGSKFAAIEPKLVGPVVHGLCRCVNERPLGPASGLCSSPCSGGGTCGGVGAAALLQLDAAASLPPLPPTTPSLAAIRVNPGPAPSTVTPTVLKPIPKIPPTNRAGDAPVSQEPNAGDGKRNIQAGVGTGGGGVPTSLLTLGGAILGVIVLVPILVVAVLRFKHRKRGSDATYNSTAKRLRPVPSTVFLEEPSPFFPDTKPPSSSSPLYPEMRTVPAFSPLPSTQLLPPQHRQRPDFAQSPVIRGLPSAVGYPAISHSDAGWPLARPDGPYVFSSPGIGGPPTGPGATHEYYPALQPAHDGYGFGAPSDVISPVPGVPDPGDGSSPAALYGPGVPSAAALLPQLEFDGGLGNPEDVFRDSLFAPYPAVAPEGEGEEFDYVLDPDAAPAFAPQQPGGEVALIDAAPPHDGASGSSEGFPQPGEEPLRPLDSDAP